MIIRIFFPLCLLLINAICAEAGATKQKLVRAAIDGKCETVQKLLDKGTDVNERDISSDGSWAGTHGYTALMAASMHGYVEIVRLLLDRGADVNIETKNRDTALVLAAQQGHVEIVKLLLDKGADVNALKYGSVTPLINASAFGYVEIVKLLLDIGAKVNCYDSESQTPMTRALRGGHVEIVKLLLDKGADLNWKSYNGDTLLSYALQTRRADLIKPLLDKGIDVNYPMPQSFGGAERPIEYAKRNRLTDIVQLLENAGAKEAPKAIIFSTATGAGFYSVGSNGMTTSSYIDNIQGEILVVDSSSGAMVRLKSGMSKDEIESAAKQNNVGIEKLSTNEWRLGGSQTIIFEQGKFIAIKDK